MRLLSWRPALLVGAVFLVPIAFAIDATAAGTGDLKTEVFATGGQSLSKPDDITAMKGSVFVAWQNGVGAAGEPAANGNTDSTVVQYSRSGQTLDHWQLTGRVDGMTADAERGRIIATVNEDGNSSLYVISLGAGGSQLVHYSYSGLTHGGGTDAPHVYRGQIFITASNPSDSTQPAVYGATLSGGVASLAPIFFDNSTASVANPGGGTTILGLTDPDSNMVVPGSSSRFGHDFMLNSQGDGQLIFVHDAGTPGQQLSVLNLSPDAGTANNTVSVDDTVWATADRGTLYATDGSHKVYAVSGHFDVGSALSTVSPGNANNAPASPGPNYLATLDLSTGALTAVEGVTFTPKGLVFVAGAAGDGA